MIGIMVETVVIAFIMGGIIGAVVALHLSHRHEPEETHQKVPVRIDDDNNHRQY